jgi:hypothetical protein
MRPRPKTREARRLKSADFLRGYSRGPWGLHDRREDTELRFNKGSPTRADEYRNGFRLRNRFPGRRNRPEAKGLVSYPLYEEVLWTPLRFYLLSSCSGLASLPSGQVGKCPRSAVRVGRTARERPSPWPRVSPEGDESSVASQFGVSGSVVCLIANAKPRDVTPIDQTYEVVRCSPLSTSKPASRLATPSTSRSSHRQGCGNRVEENDPEGVA